MDQHVQIKMNFKGTVYEKGYGQVSRMVMIDRTIHAMAKALYAYLCSYAGSNVSEDRYAWPSVKTIMDDLAIKSEETFQKYRKQLVDAGYMTIEQERNTDGTFKKNVYVIELIVQKKEPTPKKSGADDRPLKNPAPIKSGPDKIGVNNKESFKNNHLKDKNKKDIYPSPSGSSKSKTKKNELPPWVANQTNGKNQNVQETTIDPTEQKEALFMMLQLGELTQEQYEMRLGEIS